MSSKEQMENMKFSESEEKKDANEAERKPAVSTHLYLKSSRSLDKDVILGRIQKRKCMNKVKNTFHSLLSLNASTSTGSLTQDPMWVDLGDLFSCP